MKAYCEMRSIRTEEDYKKAREAILASERLVLNVLCFDLRLDHPISPCVLKLKSDLKSYIPQDQVKRVELVNNALSFLRDSSGSVLCIIYPAKIIAMGAAFLSLLNSNLYPINSSSLQRSEIDSNSNYSITEIARVWYELIKDDITIDELMDVCNQMLEVYILWSERDSNRSSSRDVVSAPDVSIFRSAIASLKETNDQQNYHHEHHHQQQQQSLLSSTILTNSSDYSRADDKEEVNLDDPYPYEDVEDHQNIKYSSNSAPVRTVENSSIKSLSTTTTTTIKGNNNNNLRIEKSIIKVVQPPPTPDFQPPPTPNFLPPPTPDFQPPSTPQFEPPPSPCHSNQIQSQTNGINKSNNTNTSIHHPTPDFVPPTPDFVPPPTPEFFLPPSTPESFPFVASPKNRLKSTSPPSSTNRSPNNRNPNSRSSTTSSSISLSTSEYNNNNHNDNHNPNHINNDVPTKRPRFQ
eukprot:CAMPEP_0174825406 /NCGR_PEP_ID=MMETSP1107-20130205/42714_1 /TAXON_ID=36770 /ORGANISM="Paraphysomonas vestita, Strain GFlagA" /LENGTH=463 /DNA_ID=CAMNT_0016056961 /DNA_START=411 /DNA_END=1802 /DNA_ORIENTATION=+